MTMLDRMRRHRGWLKWSLGLVVLSFIVLYLPNRRLNGQPVGSREVVASVDGRDITVDRFRRVYLQQMQAYRNAFGGNMDERLLKQLGIDQRILQGLIEEEAALSEAGKLGIKASDEEVSPASCRCRRSRRTAGSSAKPAIVRSSRSRIRRSAPMSSRSRSAAAS